jgi:hypothetical protein
MADKKSRLAEIYKAEKERGGGIFCSSGVPGQGFGHAPRTPFCGFGDPHRTRVQGVLHHGYQLRTLLLER